MNKKQKICLWLGIIAIVIMLFYPPWVSKKHNKRGYAFITEPHIGDYDRQRQGIQIGVLALITSGLIVSLKGKKVKAPPHPH